MTQPAERSVVEVHRCLAFDTVDEFPTTEILAVLRGNRDVLYYAVLPLCVRYEVRRGRPARRLVARVDGIIGNRNYTWEGD